MIVKAIYKDKERDYFRDKTTAENVENQVKRHYGDVFECADELAQERIEKGLVIQATDEETRKYVDSIDTNDNENQNNDELSLLEEFSYSELQTRAKELGLKSVGVSKDNLIKSIKESAFVVTQEDDGNAHVRPVVDGEIVDTPVEQVIPLDKPEAKISKLLMRWKK